jgi:hypothetical protein
MSFAQLPSEEQPFVAQTRYQPPETAQSVPTIEPLVTEPIVQQKSHRY